MYIFLNFISNNSFIGHNMLFYVKKTPGMVHNICDVTENHGTETCWLMISS